MNKIFVFFIIMMAVVIIVLFSSKSSVPQSQDSSQAASPTHTIANDHITDIIHGNEAIRFGWIEVISPQSIDLWPNFTEKLTTASFKDRLQCQGVVNGGFYSKNYTPIGLFHTQGTDRGAWISNNLFNGIVSSASDGTISIGITVPNQPMRFTLQSGPILLERGSLKKLVIKNDEKARRVIIAVTNKKTVLFLALYNPDNPYEGPLLADTPELIEIFQQKTGIILTDAINLDGGSASTFFTSDISLQELTPVGSFFCIK